MPIVTGQDILAADVLAATANVPEIVRKTADEIVNNSAVLQNDDHLVFAVAANEVWEILLVIKFSVAHAFSEGTEIAFSIPAAASITRLPPPIVIGQFGAAGQDATTSTQIYNNVISNYYWIARYVYVGGANAGNVQLQWAQHAAHATDNTFHENSFIVAHKVG